MPIPDVQIEIMVGHTGAHLEALRAGDLDVAFVCGAGPARELAVKPLRWERIVLALPEDDALTRSLAVRAEQLAGASLVLFPRLLEPFLYDHLTGEVLGAAGAAPRIALEATTLESTYTAVAAGLGVAFVAESTTRILAACGSPTAPSRRPHQSSSWAWHGAPTSARTRFAASSRCSTSSAEPMRQPSRQHRRDSSRAAAPGEGTIGKVTSTTGSKPGPVIVASVLGADDSNLSPEPGQLPTKPRSDGRGWLLSLPWGAR